MSTLTKMLDRSRAFFISRNRGILHGLCDPPQPYPQYLCTDTDYQPDKSFLDQLISFSRLCRPKLRSSDNRIHATFWVGAMRSGNSQLVAVITNILAVLFTHELATTRTPCGA